MKAETASEIQGFCRPQDCLQSGTPVGQLDQVYTALDVLIVPALNYEAVRSRVPAINPGPFLREE